MTLVVGTVVKDTVGVPLEDSCSETRQTTRSGFPVSSPRNRGSTLNGPGFLTTPPLWVENGVVERRTYLVP